MNRVLMIAFHYPPCFGSSGIQRTLKFSRYLPDEGWEPIVLTAHPPAYLETSPAQLSEIPKSVPVIRAFALNSARHLSLRGKYARRLALPNRWVTWWLGAEPAGLGLVRKYRPTVLYSTFPIATAHRIGATLQRLTSLPWVADFRDSMTEDDYPRHPREREAYRRIERRVAKRAAWLVFTAESSRTMYLKRYPALPAERFVLIPNGYDEEEFQELAMSVPPRSRPDRPLTRLHAGAIYPDERDPRPSFHALSALKTSGRITASGLRIELRAPGSVESNSALIRELRIEDLVHLLPALPYRQVLDECARADGLLLLQGPSCNHQIPAKAYEYLRLRRQILALTSHKGDTAALLRETGGATIVDLVDESELCREIPQFVDALRGGYHPLPSWQRVEAYARHTQARRLAACLDDLAAARGSGGAAKTVSG